MRILIIDDSIDKISNLLETINTLPFKCIIDNTETTTNALLLLKEKVYDIAIVDLHLPLRKGEQPNPKGGKQLIDEIYRKNEILNVPKYIIGFSQYDEESEEFSSIWKVVRYVPSSNSWKNSILNLFKHVSISKNYDKIDDDKILPTIIAEGVTDLDYLNLSFELFFPQKKYEISIISQPNAGANWVANQIVIWALQNFKDTSSKIIKSVGLLDSDEAGNFAKKTIHERLKSQTEQNSFKIVQVLPKYNPEVLAFYKVKCKIELEIESLFPIEVFEYAEEKNWLEHRNNTFVENPTDWEQHNQTSNQYITSKGISTKQLLYTKKVKLSKKIDFSKYVLSLENKKDVFKNFEYLLIDILEVLE